MKRRQVLGQMSLAALGLTGTSVQAQNFPAKPIRIVVPYAAGGSPDTVARILTLQLGSELGQSVLVENISGSSGIAAIEVVRNGAADGHTLLMADAAHWAVNRVTRAKLPHNFQKDMAPVSIASYSALYLCVFGKFPASNLNELVAAIKAKPGAYTYGSSGIGSLHHLSMEAFKSELGLNILHVPYKGTGQSVPALVGGQVDMAIAAYNSIVGFAKEGRIKVIAGNTRERMTILPQFPPMGDAGLKDFHFPGENALFVPFGTPKLVIDRLAAAIAKVLAMPDIVAKLNAAGVEPPKLGGAAALAETVQRDVARYESVVRIAGIQPE